MNDLTVNTKLVQTNKDFEEVHDESLKFHNEHLDQIEEIINESLIQGNGNLIGGKPSFRLDVLFDHGDILYLIIGDIRVEPIDLLNMEKEIEDIFEEKVNMSLYLSPPESDVDYKYTEEANNTFETPVVISFRKDKVEG